MRECPNCKTMLEDDEMFCHECGTKQVIEEIAAQNEDSSAPSEKKCVHCGETIDEDSAFCPYCGKSQTVEEDVKEVEPEQQAEKPQPEEKPVPEEKTEPKVTPAQEAPGEQTTYEVEEETKSKAWIWILLTILLIGVGAWYFFGQNTLSFDSNDTMPETVDTDSIEEPDEIDEYEEITPMSPLTFLEQFYKGNYKNEEYIKQYVTANVINKLKRDYGKDCLSGDCLATWVFTAYPPGSDLYLEEGPIITESKKEGKYSVYYSYYTQGQSGRIYKPRGLLLSVTQIDGNFLISDYELVMPDLEQKMDDVEVDEDAIRNDIPDGEYLLTDGRLRMKLQKRNSKVNGEFYFFDGSDRSADYLFSGNLDDDNMLNADVCYAAKSDRNEGTIEGIFNGEEFNVRVCLNYGRYNGNYKLKEQ